MNEQTAIEKLASVMEENEAIKKLLQSQTITIQCQRFTLALKDEIIAMQRARLGNLPHAHVCVIMEDE